MTVKPRVSGLARELGLTSKQVLDKLAELGEYVKSPSSTVELPVARRLRQCFPTAKPAVQPRSSGRTPHVVAQVPPPRRGVWERMNDPFDPLYTKPRYIGRRRNFYRGEPPHGLARFLLDEYLVPKRREDDPPPRTAYWEDEVDDAAQLTTRWSSALLDGLTFGDILGWIRCQCPVQTGDGVALHHAGVRPTELGWSYEDRGLGTLGERLLTHQLTLDEVINEALDRRTRPR
jgi:hypothetical protein